MKTSKFQVIILVVLVICIIGGVIAFATFKGSGAKDQLPPITVWGTFPKESFDQYVTQINYTLPQQMTVKYVQESPATFSSDFIAALARGTGPDAILIPADLLLSSADKLTPVPYSVLPQRTFMNAFIDESSVYLSPNGELGIPFVTDPLVMYWNRDMFNAAGIVMCPDTACPVYWDQFKGYNEKLTEKQDNGTITRSAIALGDFTNVVNAREIFGTLLLQLGNPVTFQNSDGTVSSALKPNSNLANPVPALDFFTQFVDPNNANYSWNRSWPDSKTAFLAGNLATYFGLASELSDLRAKNPNLNFDIAPLPQARTGGAKAAYSRLYGFSIVKASQNANTAYQIISELTQPDRLAKISATLYLPSVSRAVIANGSNDPYMAIFNQEALIAKTWLDTDPAQSRQIFSDMVSSVTSGQKSAIQALNEADSQYGSILRQAVVPTTAWGQGTSALTAAVADVPPVNINDSSFKLVICDGPAGANLNHDPNYRTCDFAGLVRQMQFIINIMITVGILAAMGGFAYGGFLYIRGNESDRSHLKSMLPKVLGGLVIMLSAWFIVSQLLVWLTGTNNYLN